MCHTFILLLSDKVAKQLFSSKENVHRHALRLLLHLHQKVLPSYMETLMKTLEPPKQVSVVSALRLEDVLVRCLYGRSSFYSAVSERLWNRPPYRQASHLVNFMSGFVPQEENVLNKCMFLIVCSYNRKMSLNCVHGPRKMSSGYSTR